MSWYDDKGYGWPDSNYNDVESPKGRTHPIIGYSARRESERYVATSEQVIEFKGMPKMADQGHNPKKNELHIGHSLLNRIPLLSRSLTRDGQPEKGQAFSLKAEDHAVHGKGKGSPLRKGNDDSPWEDRHFSTNGKAKETYFREDDHNNDRHTKANVFTPPSYNPQFSSHQTRKAPSYYEPELYENDKSRGVASSVPSPDTKQARIDSLSQGSKDDKIKGMGYVPPTHTTAHPRKDVYHEKSKNSKDGGNLSVPPPHTGSVMGRGRRDDGYQETINSLEAKRRYGGAKPRSQTYEGTYTETIDCIEAARKYNGVLVPS